MPRTPPRIASSDGPDREIPESVLARCERYRDKHLAIVWEELAIRGVLSMPQEIIDSATEFMKSVEREGEHARGLRDTVRHEPPDPDRVREPVVPRRDPIRRPGADPRHGFDCKCAECITTRRWRP